MQNQGNSKLVAGIVAILVVIGGIFGFAVSKSKTAETTTPVVPSEPVATSVPPTDTTKRSAYKDGTYSATGSYMSPGGADRLGVSLTLKNDIVTSLTVTNMAGDGTSDRYQDKFIGGIQTLVVGKNIDSLNVDVVSGSSLTHKGFEDAVTQIKAQAKA